MGMKQTVRENDPKPQDGENSIKASSNQIDSVTGT